MPPTRSKNKKQITKRRLNKESICQPKNLMKTRLMAISLKADDYIYKQKPISIQEAETYARELEAFRNQCQDERYLQVIEKLTGYMKCIIRERAPKDTIDANINPIGNPIEDAATPENSAIIDLEMERSLSNLSIATDPKYSLAHIDNVDIHQKKAKIEDSNSAVIKGILKKVVKHKVAYTNKESDTSIHKPVDKKQKEFVDDSIVETQNMLSDFEFDNYASLSSLRKSSNKQIQPTVEYAAIKIANSEKRNTGNDTNNPENNHLNNIHQTEIEIVDDNSNLSQNILNDFEYINYSGAVVSHSNINPRNSHQGNEIVNNIAYTINKDTKNSNMDTRNDRTKLEAVINFDTIKRLKNDEILDNDSTKLSQNIMSSIENSDYASRFLQHNLQNDQPLHANERPNNITDVRYKVTNSSNINTGKFDAKSKMSNLYDIDENEKELDGNSNDISQNILVNYGNKKDAAVGIVRDNTNFKNYQTIQINDTQHTSNDDTHSKNNLVQHKTFKPSAAFNDIKDTIFKSNTQNKFVPPKMMQHDITNKPLQKQTNKIEPIKKRKKPAKNNIGQTEKKRTYKRKSKVNDMTTARNDLIKEKVDSANLDAKCPEKFVNNSKQKNQRTLLRKKTQEIDISWVENMKFVRAIESDEYFKFDSLEESFWTDLTLPSNMSFDFEYDQINIWKY